MRIRWSSPALHDFKNISYRIEEERDLAKANRICRTIYDAIQMLRRYPFSGRQGDKEGTRELVVSATPYIVAYRVIESEAIQVLTSGTALRTGADRLVTTALKTAIRSTWIRGFFA